ncbi:MAG: MBL fold metallo-hydrolase [Candidatus Neomarinimicrobiota bacterium]|jgi:phosphoribosyl 1,2-cyclic phosphodiesterase
MKITPLSSGSKGNSYLIESGKTHILIDAGLSAKQLGNRLMDADCDPSNISAIFVTHEHGDHIGGVRVFSKKFKIPVYMNIATYNAACEKHKLEQLNNFQEFKTGEAFDFQDIHIHPLKITHDTADPVCFTVNDGRHLAAIVTDLGKLNTLVSMNLRKADILVLESNHDLSMLKCNPMYPEKIKQRIRSNFGHLSNEQSAKAALEVLKQGKLKHLILAHLSENNNSETKVRQCFEKHFRAEGIDFPISFAKQHIVSDKIIL